MIPEEKIKYRLKNLLLDPMYRGDFWRGYAEALAEVLEIEINEI